MYSNRFVCSVKVNGSILRENAGVVTLPFGAEYGLLLKNLNSRRAMVKVTVDGKDATEGMRLILPVNGSLELERYIRNGNLNSGNRFKFVERTAAVEAHRGIQENDGLIRCEFWAEREKQETVETIVRRHYIDEYEPWYIPRPPIYPKRPRPHPWWDDGIRFTSSTRSGSRIPMGRTGGPSASSRRLSATPKRSLGPSGQTRGGFRSFNDAGITVPGSVSNQQFQSASGFALETNSTVIVLQLRGEVGGKVVAAPVTVKSKPTCSTCGKANKAGMKFCGECGTALDLV